jgi:hypothetical protein
MAEEKVYKIRKLTRKDRKTFTSLIQKLALSLKNDEILDLIKHGVTSEKESKKDPGKEQDVRVWAKLGVELLNNILDTLDKECAEWFADLIGVTQEEFDNLPMDIEIKIIDQLMSCEEIDNFFESALQLRSMISGLFGKQKNPKTK